MSRYARHWSVLIAVLLIASFLFAFPTSYLQAATAKIAGADALTVAQLKAAYTEAAAGGEKVRILVVPGHEPMYGGAQYAGYYERELVIPLSEKLATELRSDPNIEVILARDASGWNPTLERYFKRNLSSIKRFVETHQKEFRKLLRRGRVDENEAQAGHNRAPADVAYRLYGITKWANENDVDLMIHVHLNDAGGRANDAPGAYTGLAIYVPYEEFGNAEASKAIADKVFDHLTDIAAKSTLPIEDQGVVEDQELIALGSNNTSIAPSLLVEYGYIYEPKFIDENVRNIVFSDYAYQTAKGVREFFGASAGGAHSTRVLPYTWTADIASSTASSIPAYALQHALKEEGYYPPRPSSLINCPIDGRMGSCVTDALKAYQTAKGITPSGRLDAATRNALNAKYSAGSFIPEPTTIASVAAPAARCAPFTTTLKLNSTDAATKGQVSRLQKILAQDTTIYPEGRVTGFFGPATDKAVKAFQVKQGIAKPGSAGYGLVGPATGKALIAVCT
ncbi:MAG TPA: peptidoglycan-binding protein [Candidatus Paceibacterota bacterium]|nr:peptidoglycan-binding protein [Candidatus Paceibacterota bacterium]